jgi:hypothetical protein
MVRGSHHTEETKAKLRVAAAKQRREVVHGTTDGYNNHGCRCESCSAVWSEYMKFRRRAERIRRGGVGHLDPEPTS